MSAAEPPEPPGAAPSAPSAPAPDAGPLAVVASTRAVLTLGDVSLVLSPATVSMSPRTGKIVAVERAVLPASDFPPGTAYADHSPRLLLPGLVDAHVHLNEPGRTDWEGFWTGTRAAASGGVTTVVDMPLNSVPPTTTVAALGEKLRACRGQCWVDVGFYGGVVPGNARDLEPLVDAGVRGFKGFLIDSGVAEFPAVSAEDVALAMDALRHSPTTLMFHAEMAPAAASAPTSGGDGAGAGAGDGAGDGAANGDNIAYRTFLDSRPPSLETRAVEEILLLAHVAPSLHLHIVHLSAAECVPLLRAARARGVNITAETCFHYLGLAAEDVAAGDTRNKCCPPIRDAANRDALWAELLAEDSCIKTVVSDHSPCTPELKLLPERLAGPGGAAPAAAGDFMAAWGGISSIGLGLPILHTAARRRSAALARADMAWKHCCSPWDGHGLDGRVAETWLRGRRVFAPGAGRDGFVVDEPFGEPLTEPRTA